MTTPHFTIIAGPNGAGKSTSSSALLPDETPYINADEIAKELVECHNKDIQASRMLLQEWDRFAAAQAHFAIETTLASRSLAPKIRKLKEAGYQFHLYFFWLPSVDLAIERVAERVRNGGHHIPEDVIRRRYEAGWQNFFDLYQPLADRWEVYANLEDGKSVLVASGQNHNVTVVDEPELWQQIRGKQTMQDDKVKEAMASYQYDVDGSREREKAVMRAIHAAVLEHKRAGNPIAVWRDGKVVILQPEEIDVPDESAE